MAAAIYNPLMALPQKKASFRVILKKYPNLFKSVIGKCKKKYQVTSSHPVRKTGCLCI
jgi:hypothetical protein